MKSSRERRPVKFQVRSRPPIFVSRQEAPYQSKNENPAARTLSRRKGKVRWRYVWGIWGIPGRPDFSLQHKVEDNIGSVAWGIIGVNDEFAFACWNQSLTDRN
jgi:hypothetical protein